jgi:galactokinase
MTGGGFGGAIIALAEVDGAQAFADAVVAAYGPRGRAYVSRAAEGATELQSTL